MDVAGALLPFTQVVRPELTIHVQEVLTQAEKDPNETKLKIPEINEPDKYEDETKGEVKNGGEKNSVNPDWWLLVVLPPHDKKHVHFEGADRIYYF